MSTRRNRGLSRLEKPYARDFNIFISWSRPLSHEVALALRDWLPNVLQASCPFVSSEDIEKGTSWGAEIEAQLEESLGIVCVTRENHDAPWLNYEAGALSRALGDKSRVCTYFVDLNPTDIKGPLSILQATVANEADTLRMLKTLNRALPTPIDEKRLEPVFNKFWPDLQARIAKLAPTTPNPTPRRTDDMLEEILERVRDLQTRQAVLSRRSLAPLDAGERSEDRPEKAEGFEVPKAKAASEDSVESASEPSVDAEK